jgi:Caspase domain
MIAAYKKIVAESETGDAVFLHYSGHGTKMKDATGDEGMYPKITRTHKYQSFSGAVAVGRKALYIGFSFGRPVLDPIDQVLGEILLLSKSCFVLVVCSTFHWCDKLSNP